MRTSGTLLSLLAASAASAIFIPNDFSVFDTLTKDSDDTTAPIPLFVNEAPLLSTSTHQDDIIKDSYIVVFHPHVHHHEAKEHHAWVQDLHVMQQQSKHDNLEKRGLLGDMVKQIPLLGGDHHAAKDVMDSVLGGIKHTYNLADGKLKGYAGTFDDHTISQVRKHPSVAYVERDQQVHTFEQQRNSPWGLARISHTNALTFSTFNKYLYDARGGEGVTAYIIDTGINIHHKDFEGRAHWGKTIPTGDDDIDGNGHGTHVAGTIASKTYGVAKHAKVVAVKVLRTNGSGSMSDVLKGVEWAAEAAIDEAKHAKKTKDKKFKGSTANMSLGGGSSRALNEAVDAAVESGLHFAVAAGNDNADSCNYSPASAENAVTVGASTLSDERAYFSNYGKCTDVFAPGLNILSTWIGSNVATNTISGTSMASPHICGLLSYLLSVTPSNSSQYSGPIITPKKLKHKLVKLALEGKLDGVPSDTVNLLAWNGGVSKNGSALAW